MSIKKEIILLTNEGTLHYYKVIGVFDNNDSFNQYVKNAKLDICEKDGNKGLGYFKRVYTLNPEHPEIPKGYSFFNVHMHEDGNVDSCDIYPWFENLDKLNKISFYVHCTYTALLMCVIAKNKKQAVKIVDTKRQEILSKFSWPILLDDQVPIEEFFNKGLL